MTTPERARFWEQRLRAGIEAFNREDFDASLEFMHPDFEWHPGEVGVEGGVLHGRDDVRALMTPDVFDRQELEVCGFEMHGDKAVLETVFHARGRSTGIELSNRIWQVWTVHDELAVRVELYDDEQSARAAAGLGATPAPPE